MIFLILSILMFVAQNLGIKEYSRRFPGGVEETARLNMLALPLGALILIPAGGLKLLSPAGWALAFAFGLSYVLVSSLYLTALPMGPFSLTAMMSSMGLLVTVLTNLLLWHEPLSALNWLGLAFILAVIAVTSLGTRGGGKVSLKWFLFALGALVFNGLCGVMQKAYSMVDPAPNPTAYSFWSFLFAAALFLIIHLNKRPAALPAEKKRFFWPLVVVVGACSVVANLFITMSLGSIPSVVAYPVMQGSLVALIALCSALLYREQFTLRTVLVLGMSIAGIVLMNL